VRAVPDTGQQRRQSQHDRAAGLVFRQTWVFNKDVIGAKRYRATMVAVSRSIGRLEVRGLLTRRRPLDGSWQLTDAGRLVAQARKV
jgi:hypothetical protein